MVHWSFILGQGWLLSSSHFRRACQNCLHPSFVIIHKAVRMHYLLLCCESSRKCHHAAQRTTPTWTKQILTCFTRLIAAQPSMAEYERKCTKLSRLIMLSCTEISFVISFFQFFRNLESNPSFLLRNWIKLLNFDMFYKNDWWAVICYPICMTNVSYERGII